jgi:hypothetical protein
MGKREHKMAITMAAKPLRAINGHKIKIGYVTYPKYNLGSATRFLWWSYKKRIDK